MEATLDERPVRRLTNSFRLDVLASLFRDWRSLESFGRRSALMGNVLKRLRESMGCWRRNGLEGQMREAGISARWLRVVRVIISIFFPAADYEE